jgi:DNA-directed RNA polymerase specialized sigma24 family protein
MKQQQSSNHQLNLISTKWSLVYRAHHGSVEGANSARRQLLDRYGGAACRYLRKVLPDPDSAEEVFQEFALRLVHGKLGGANPQRGRFRNFLKGTLFHLIADYHKHQRQWPGPLPADDAALAAHSEGVDADRQFTESWRDELLARAWAGLAALEAATGQAVYAVLRFRADHPEMRSPQMAEHFTAKLGRPFTPAGVRQALHRAREKFADLLVDEVTHSLGNATAEELEEELVDLGLLDYCQPALERRGLQV